MPFIFKLYYTFSAAVVKDVVQVDTASRKMELDKLADILDGPSIVRPQSNRVGTSFWRPRPVLKGHDNV